MTHTTNDAPVTVEQCDRDLAAVAQRALYPQHGEDAGQGTLDGVYDQSRLVQAFARHRLAALASAPAGDGVDIAGEMDRFEAAYPCCDLAKYKGGEVIAGRARYAEPEVDKMFSAWLSSAALARPRAAVGEPNSILEQAAQEAYRVCAETRHVTLGDKARAAILALQSPPAKVEG